MADPLHPTPCIHGDSKTLCPSCQAEYDSDPTAWEEFGHHADGERRWAELQAEIAAEMASATPPTDHPEIPF